MLSPNPIVCSTVGTFGWEVQNVSPTRFVVGVRAGGGCGGSTQERGGLLCSGKHHTLVLAFLPQLTSL